MERVIDQQSKDEPGHGERKSSIQKSAEEIFVVLNQMKEFTVIRIRI